MIKEKIANVFGYVKEDKPYLHTPFKVFNKKGRFVIREKGWIEYWNGKNWRAHSINLIGYKQAKWFIKYER